MKPPELISKSNIYPAYFQIGLACIVFLIIMYLAIPLPNFEGSYSTILQDEHEQLIGGMIAEDGQWRFPPAKTIPEKFRQAIITFEDKKFLSHPGVDILAIGRAIRQNIKARRVISGGSTITMQLVRLSRKGQARTMLEKIIEGIYALKTDLVWDKEYILKQYVSHAPFGGNVVGLTAASWRYFGRDPSKLSWADAALLAVLPNHPAMIHPGKNRNLLHLKRDRLLKKLYARNIIDKTTYELSLLEELPLAPKPLPQLAPHLLQQAISDGKKGKTITSTLHLQLQQRVLNTIRYYHTFLWANSVHNGAALIMEVATGKVLAYVGNTAELNSAHENDVNIISSPRSYGSLLKPILYAAMLEEGSLMPEMLVPDIPTNINGYSPQNFNKSYEGTVSASKVLSHSLNVPSVRLLQQLGTKKFLFILNQLGLNHLTKPADHYGLSIILGGGESTMWELASMYGQMAQHLGGNEVVPFFYDIADSASSHNIHKTHPLGQAPLWCTAEAISESKRPGANGSWEIFNSSQKIAWKTGTSYGFRDAWSIGFTSKYVVAVWFGNANGEGRAGLTGIGTAAPAMFELFNLLDHSPWFNPPHRDMVEMTICSKSGHKATEICTETKRNLIPKTCLRTQMCPYHIKVLLDKTGKRVNSDCEKVANMVMENRFVLPPIQEWYYKPKDASYIPLPPFREDCKKIGDDLRIMEIIYPRRGSKVFIPKELSGKMSKIVLEVAHRRQNIRVYWHLDDTYLGVTDKFHQMECFTTRGKHKLTVIDDSGETEEVFFEVLDRG